jgi:hypothetical protein
VGYYGDPAAATEAAGEALIEATVPALAQFFADFASTQLRVGAFASGQRDHGLPPSN